MNKKVTYTVTELDEFGHVKIYLSPNHGRPAPALKHLRHVMEKDPRGIYLVLRVSEDFLDEEELIRRIQMLDSESKKA